MKKNSKNTKNGKNSVAFNKAWELVRNELIEIHRENNVFWWLPTNVTPEKGKSLLYKSWHLVEKNFSGNTREVKLDLYKKMKVELEDAAEVNGQEKPKQDPAKHTAFMRQCKAEKAYKKAKAAYERAKKDYEAL